MIAKRATDLPGTSSKRLSALVRMATGAVIGVAVGVLLPSGPGGIGGALAGAVLGVYVVGLFALRDASRARYGRLASYVAPLVVSCVAFVALSWWPGVCGKGCTVNDRAQWAVVGLTYPLVFLFWRAALWPLYAARGVWRLWSARTETSIKQPQAPTPTTSATTGKRVRPPRAKESARRIRTRSKGTRKSR